jgi:hypothetical protein
MGLMPGKKNMMAAQMYSWRRMASMIIQMVKATMSRTNGFRSRSALSMLTRPGIRVRECY